jgi:hypothetical protein
MESRDGGAAKNTLKMNSRWNTVGFACLVAALWYLAARLAGSSVINLLRTIWPLWPGCAVLFAILLVVPQKCGRFFSRRAWQVLFCMTGKPECSAQESGPNPWFAHRDHLVVT